MPPSFYPPKGGKGYKGIGGSCWLGVTTLVGSIDQ